MTDNDRAHDYVLGDLSPGERASIARERLYNKALDAEISALEAVHGAVDARLKDKGGAPDIWSKLRGAIQEEAEVFGDKSVEEFAEGGWAPHGEGIDFKQLWDENTILIRCVPGGFEEPHDQPEDQIEQIVVVAGDLHIGGRVFETGDHLSIPAGTVHPRMWSEGGCILFTQYIRG